MYVNANKNSAKKRQRTAALQKLRPLRAHGPTRGVLECGSPLPLSLLLTVAFKFISVPIRQINFPIRSGATHASQGGLDCISRAGVKRFQMKNVIRKY